ncbi:isoprenoid biosynthesis glyoxalase ElbB [Beggiatoa leptomitoformis]|uniref:Isoprenoid biosynthesis glyoxalase ElbB n=1 Tax=Beggiatoa leptomitoformis TaxID=288004 RepID=A0A2N9YAR0_9GAMM|nr:isoprenoid biosynthesis glyoxalase ElbB [Beggiatoa leptomitoformis]ALG67051.1 isoprenoid biosynthesis glyoxalase ElbB [Beggiatoa leptomitoformis]AUI67567.1 isoprenoid biosynthesis glyoxalase ElbB [Beggiatoa leptomitoformis]
MKIGVLLSGCGVYDGSEIHEAVLTLLALDRLGVTVQCIAPDSEQYHVINHLNGAEMVEKRNVLVEAARIARGHIQALQLVNSTDLDGLILAGGFGAAKNLSQWAFAGADGHVLPAVQQLIVEMVQAKKPIAALCIAPVVVAKALQGSGITTTLTVGTTEASSPYDIAGISAGLNSAGAEAVMMTVDGIVIDKVNKIITSPCYMMEASIAQVFIGIEKTCKALVEMIRETAT